ncbi:signal peptide peptidase SppA [Patescibacteria group bacterium]|nr:signal peptide peptidase SppA [Patescibacteria group bacterium]
MKFKLFDKERDMKLFKRIGMAIVLVACVIIIKDELVWQFGGDDNYYDDYSYSENYSGDCNVVKIDLKGFIDIETYEDGDVSSSEIVGALEDIENNPDIKAVIMDIDSTGGVPVAGEEISNALSRIDKPAIALIRAFGDSAAYWSAVGADRIFASANSDVGSIGVTMSYLDNVQQNQITGLNYNSLSSGKFKDTGDPNKTLTWEEKQYLIRDVNIMNDNFIKAVAEKRNLDIAKVKKLADGSSMLGQMALDNGLIDEIGDIYAVKNYLENLIGEEVIICY